MPFEVYLLIIGLILTIMALIKPVLEQSHITPAIIYLFIGVGLSALGAGVLHLDGVRDSLILERVSEATVVTSLFVCGLKLQVSWKNRLWLVPLRLAFLSMTLSVAFVTLVGTYLLGLPLGVSLILGAVLAPTDPVLASQVQVKNEEDRDRLRFGLTGEAGFNDGTAFPFLYLGLGLMGSHSLGDYYWKWWTLDILWGILGGLAIGAILGIFVGRLLFRIQALEEDNTAVHEFAALGLVLIAYGVAVALGTHGFLAAFSAGVTLRSIEKSHDGTGDEDETFCRTILGFKERVERLLEALSVILLGALVATLAWDPAALWFVPLFFLILRPVAVYLGLIGAKLRKSQLKMISWFGIRGIGSIYYLSYAIENGLGQPYSQHLCSLVYPVLACSIVLHGLSVSATMREYVDDKDR